MRSVAGLMLIVYLTVLLALTLLPDAGSDRGSHIRVYLTPFHTIGLAFRQGFGSHEWKILVGNLLAFLPLGILLPLAQPRLGFVFVVLVALGLSVAIETAQLAISLAVGLDYRTADIDDVILNVCGAAIGYLALAIWRLTKISKPA